MNGSEQLQDMLRRDFIKSGFSVACVLAAGTSGFSVLASAAETDAARTNIVNLSMKLATSLRSLGSGTGIAVAARLEASKHSVDDVHLHLRRAGLNASQAVTIAGALASLTDDEAAWLASLSLSFNEDIGDVGAVALAQTLPTGLRELGLVGCGIGDHGGEQLLQWATRAPRLRMMCIEQNKLSASLRSRFADLAATNSKLLVVV